MARKITVTKAELAALEELGYKSDCRPLLSLLAKARAAHAPVQVVDAPGLSLKAISDTMFELAPSRWAAHVAGNPSRHLRVLYDAGVTIEQVGTVARWLERQRWMKSRATLEMLAGHWSSWLSQATADQVAPPPSAVRRGPASFDEE